MKLLRKDIDQFGCGAVALKPSVPEDMWGAYNLIAVGDRVTCGTFRKLQKVSSTGTTSNNRVKLTLTVEVGKVDFAPKDGKLRLAGKVASDNPHVKRGAFHTLELEAPRKFTVHKALWDSVALTMLEEACDEKCGADLAAVVMEMGLCHVCLVTRSMTVTKAKIELAVPRKRPGSNQHEKQRAKFFEYILQALVQHIDWKVVKAVVVASPGFVKDQFMEYLNEQLAKQRELPGLCDNRQRLVKARCSSGHKHAVKEILSDPAMLEQLKDVQAAGEVAALQRFYEMFNTDANRAVYGLEHVRASDEASAIETLLLTNELLRADDVATRKMFVEFNVLKQK